jgi:hypothetical protein
VPVVKDSKAADSCPGTSALGALQLATDGNWAGPWDSGFGQYEIYTIEGETHEFEEGAAANYFWALWAGHKEAQVGACEETLENGEEVLFFPSCYGTACPPNSPLPLAIEAPTSVNVGESVTITIEKYSTGGVPSPVEGATVSGASEAKVSGSGGHATLTFAAPGEYTLRASAPELVRSETTICVHNGNDGNCSTQAPSGSTITSSAGTTGSTATPTPPYKGPYALVAKVTGVTDGHVYRRRSAPRVLSGDVAAHSPISAVSLELRREYKGRCYAYEGVRERFLGARCGEGSFFKVSTTGSFSYLLPSALPPGRYVLDIKVSDAAGNTTTLARGTSRIVFYVR